MWTKIRDGIVRWYEGVFEPYANDPNSSAIIMGGDYRRHWTAHVARALVRFWLAHWKWIVTTVIAIAGVLLAARRLSGH